MEIPYSVHSILGYLLQLFTWYRYVNLKALKQARMINSHMLQIVMSLKSLKLMKQLLSHTIRQRTIEMEGIHMSICLVLSVRIISNQ